jgi:hypothetical protein
MGLRRHCYNKPWRCPGWAGGGWSTPTRKRDICLHGGSFAGMWGSDRDRWYLWRWHKCSMCGTVAIPYVTRWLDPTFLQHHVWLYGMTLREWWQWKRRMKRP